MFTCYISSIAFFFFIVTFQAFNLDYKDWFQSIFFNQCFDDNELQKSDVFIFINYTFIFR